MRTKPDRYSARNDLKSPANRVAVLLGFFYFLDHLLSHIRKYASNDVVIPDGFQLLPRSYEAGGDAYITDRRRIAEDIDTEVSKKHIGPPATYYASSLVSCARSVDN